MRNSSSREISDLPLHPLRLREIRARKARKDRMETMEAMGVLGIQEASELKESKALPVIQDVLVQTLRFQAQWATRELPEPQDEPGLLE